MHTQGVACYNARKLTFRLPKGWTLVSVVQPRPADEVPDLRAALYEQLQNPLGARGLDSLVSPSIGKVVLLSEDQTRPSPIGSVMLPVLQRLNELGVDDGKINVIIAKGTHRPPTRDEIREKLGAEIVNRFDVSIHDPDDEKNLVFLGNTERGTPAWINRDVVEADVKIGLGTFNIHYFAGYGGGPKIVLPGVSGRKTIRHNHSLVDHAMARQGVLDHNPVWEDMRQVAEMAHLDLKIDVVLNAHRRIHTMAIGEAEAVQRANIGPFLGIYSSTLPQRGDVVITSGNPLEANLIQSGKAILLADPVTRDGGTIVLVSACRDGAGPGMYETLSERPEPQEVIRWIGEGRASTTGGPMASRIREILKKKRIMLVTEGLTGEQANDMEMMHATSMDEAVDQLSQNLHEADVVCLPSGGCSVPLLAEGAT